SSCRQRRWRSLRTSGASAFHQHGPARKETPRVVTFRPEIGERGFFRDARLQRQKPLEQRLGAGGTTRDVHVDRQEAVDALHDRVDRKSTRLNSSHVKISYAAFCLKKKQKLNYR